MFCFENVMFETCKPILVVYIVFVLCIMVIAAVMFQCLCSSDDHDKDYFENSIETGTFHIVYIHGADEEKKDLVEEPASTKDLMVHTPHSKLASEVLLQQLEIYQMANYNAIQPAYI